MMKDLGKADKLGAPARLALLDVASVDNQGKLRDAPDGKFTQADIMKFLQEFENRKGKMDYSRYDLNGNGQTGESYPATTGNPRFDLDGNYVWEQATQSIQGIPVSFDEKQPADITILIFYAYSPLYEGNEFERDMLLAPYLENFNSTVLHFDSLFF